MTRVEPPPSVTPPPSPASTPSPTPPAGRSSPGPVEFALLLLGAEVCRHVDQPVRAAGLVFAGGAVWIGWWLMVRRRPVRRVARVTLTLGLAAAAGLLIWHVAALALYPLVGDYERCVRQAQTRQAGDTCQSDLTDRLRDVRGERG